MDARTEDIFDLCVGVPWIVTGVGLVVDLSPVFHVLERFSRQAKGERPLIAWGGAEMAASEMGNFCGPETIVLLGLGNYSCSDNFGLPWSDDTLLTL